MPPAPTRPGALAGRLFRGSDAVRSGRLTRHQLHSSAWRRLFPDVYACASLDVTHELRAAAVLGLLLPDAVACGGTAAVLWGAALNDPDDDVEVTVPTSVRGGAVAGVRVNRRSLRAGEVTRRRGLAITTPKRTALDLARMEPLEEAVVALDRFLQRRLVAVGDVREAAAASTGRNCRRARAAIALADGLAESPQETRLRLLLHRSPLPDPVAQHVVRDRAGAFVGRVDFAWPDVRLAVEYDGAWHGAADQLRRDRRRMNAIARAGWRVFFVTAADLRRPERLLALLVEAYEAARCAAGR